MGRHSKGWETSQAVSSRKTIAPTTLGKLRVEPFRCSRNRCRKGEFEFSFFQRSYLKKRKCSTVIRFPFFPVEILFLVLKGYLYYFDNKLTNKKRRRRIFSSNLFLSKIVSFLHNIFTFQNTDTGTY
jgi:hypothetical protein